MFQPLEHACVVKELLDLVRLVEIDGVKDFYYNLLQRSCCSVSEIGVGAAFSEDMFSEMVAPKCFVHAHLFTNYT